MTTPDYNNTPGDGEGWGKLALVLLSAGSGALLHKAATKNVHQAECQQAYDQGHADGRSLGRGEGYTFARQEVADTLRGKDGELARSNRLLASKDDEVARLRKLDGENLEERIALKFEMALQKLQIARLENALAGHKVDLTVPLSPPDEKNLNGNRHS